MSSVSHIESTGVEQVTALWQGWATALPDSKATFHKAVVSGETVLLEVTWNGTHTGPLQTPTGSLAATGKRIELRAVSMNVENRRILDMPRSLACLLLPCAVAAPAERSPASPKTRPSKE
jgi:SnoaL-like polyketide cyclase